MMTTKEMVKLLTNIEYTLHDVLLAAEEGRDESKQHNAKRQISHIQQVIDQLDRQGVSKEDIYIWPCGEWCYREEYPHMAHKTDDYETLHYNSTAYNKFMKSIGNDQ